MKNPFTNLLSLVRKFSPSTSGGVSVKTRPIGTISARVYRAKSGKWEDCGILVSGEIDVDGVIQVQED